MAPVVHGTVLAVVNTPIVTHNVKELVEIPGEEGEEPTIAEEWVPVYANPGDIIDVAAWHGIGAYQERGQITLLTPSDAKAHLDAGLPIVNQPDPPKKSKPAPPKEQTTDA